MRRRLELRVELVAVAEPDVLEPCKPGAVRFVGRSCVARVVAEPRVLPPSEALAEERWPRSQASLTRRKLVVRLASPLDELEERWPAKTQPELMELAARLAARRPGMQEAEAWIQPETRSPVLLPVAQPWWDD